MKPVYPKKVAFRNMARNNRHLLEVLRVVRRWNRGHGPWEAMWEVGTRYSDGYSIIMHPVKVDV